jgi:hypothetical protein
MPQPPQDIFPRPHRAAAYVTDPGTDADGARRYEALYRESVSEVPWRGRAVRQYEPTLQAPEDPGDDPFGWLFRDSAESPAAPPAPQARPTVPTVTPQLQESPERVAPADAPLRGAGPGRLIIVLLALLAIVVGAGTGAYIVTREHRVTAGAAAPTTTAAPTTAAVPAAGTVTALAPIAADADCQAPSATDDGGRPVDYGSQQLIDGQPGTGWRCDGTAVGRSVTFTFASTAQIAEVGLLNGYPKVDPTSGVQRYGEYRRVTSVTWAFPGGASFTQVLADGVQTVQTMRIPAQQASQVTMTIDATTAPGVATTAPGARHDALVVGEATFAQLP